MKGERKRNDEFGHKIEFEMMLEIKYHLSGRQFGW